MKIAQINATCGAGSTGKICLAVSKMLTDKGIDNRIYYSQGYSNYPYAIKFANEYYKKIQALCARLFGNWGFNSRLSTKKLIKLLDDYNPDIIHLHNIHAHECNLEQLLTYLSTKKVKIFWTFHDCWAFTGYCMHFTSVDCYQWEEECSHCPKRKEYSWLFDRSKQNYIRKKELLSNLDFTIITPSKWLSDIVKRSFLQDKDVKTINNGIDTTVFYPRKNHFREKYNCSCKYIVLGVAQIWDERKGIDVFIELSKLLGFEYQIVLVGTDTKIDKLLPENIISIHRTESQDKLADIYSAANVFVNPTREENFPTVNIEAIACGCPVVTYDTGGSAEMLSRRCGIIVEKDNLSELINAVKLVCEKRCFNIDDCVKQAENYIDTCKFNDYTELYLMNGTI